MIAMETGPLDLLVMQATTYCNLNCNYCYLTTEQRRTRARMSLEVVRKTSERVKDSGLIRRPFSIVWHSGEPLAAGYAFYENAFEIMDEVFSSCPYTHVIQTNGTLINEKWCELFKKHRVNIGLSLDGPRDIHDRNRVDWKNHGSFEQVFRAAKLLKEQKIPFYTISVVGQDSLTQGREIYRFLRELGPSIMGFSAEETEGANQSGLHSLADPDLRQLRNFWCDIYQEALKHDEVQRVREFKNIYKGLYQLTLDAGKNPAQSQLVAPYRIISVDFNGDFSTFSPELLPMKNERFGNFIFGNVLHDDLMEVYHNNERFRAVAAEIARGVEECRASCEFFNICRGGAPSNKLMERGRFDVAETNFCRHSRQTPALAVIEHMESLLGVAQ